MKQKEDLLHKYFSGDANAEEKALVESWYLDLNKDKKELSQQELEEEFYLGFKNINKAIDRHKRLFYIRISAAAAIVFLVLGSLFLLNNRYGQQPSVPKQNQLANQENLKNKVVLTLSDGRKINVGNIQSGSAIEEEGAVLSKSSGTELSYSSSDAKNINAFNSIQTPVGLSFRINLPDGSKVWINSMSKLKYPVRFHDDERTVELDGEAYFEIAKDNKADGSRKPFKVISGNQTIEVLGTHFNVRSYEDENLVKTTLLEGAVKVHFQALAKVLKPGEQAAYSKPDNSVAISEVNPEDVIAWKEGYFSFKDIDVVAFMNDLKRWYDIDVEYKGELKSKRISGTFSRSKNLSELLLSVEDLGDYKFKIVPGDASGNGRRVVVMSN